MDTVSMLNKMSFYCQPILPLVYDESMSYYETLCKVVGQLNTTGDVVNKLNEGLTGEIADRQAADAELEERLKVIEDTNAKIHFLVFDGANPNGGFPTRHELYQWVEAGDAIFTLLRTYEEGRGQIDAVSCSYNAGNWGSEASNDFSIIVPIETNYDATRDYAVKQKVAKLTIPPIPQTNLNAPWGLQIIEVNTPYTSAEGVVNLVAVINDSDSVNCSITPSEFLGLYNMTRGGKNLCVAVNAKLSYDGLARSSSIATVDTTNRKIRIAFERDYGTFTENGVKQLNKTLDYIIGDASTNVWTHETIDSKTLDFSRYEGFQFTRGENNVITANDESTPNAVWAQYQSDHSGKIYQNLPVRLIDTVDNAEYWNGVFDIKDDRHMTFTFVTSNYVTASGKMPVRVIELSADVNTTAWKYAAKEFELPITGSFTVDDALSDTSTNPVQNKAVKAALDGKAGTAVATASANGLMSAADKTKLDGVEAGANKTTVDAALDAASENPVQNKAVKAALDGKLDKTGGTLTGNLKVTGALFSGDGLSFGTGENIHFTKAADDAGKLAHGAAGVDDTAPLARLKVASPTEDDDAATKAYVDGRAAGTGAVRYDAAQTLTGAQKLQARKNVDAAGVVMPQFQGFLTLTPANGTLGAGVGLSPTRDGNNFALDISDVNEGTPTKLTGVKTPTDADTNAAATVEYVKAKVASGGSADAVLYTPQTLTDAQKKQARDNIYAASDFVVNATITIDGYGNYTATSDKTFGQIQEAVNGGKRVIAHLVFDESGAEAFAPLMEVTAQHVTFVYTSSDGNDDINLIVSNTLVITSNSVSFYNDHALSIDGNTFEMPQIVMASGPVGDMQIATKKYVDAHLSGEPITIKLGTGNTATSTATFAQIRAALEAGKAPILDSAPGTSHWFALNWALSEVDRLIIQYGTFNVDGGGKANFTITDVNVSTTGITYVGRQFTTE